MMIHITSTYFCAAVVLENDRVVRAAPILKWMMGWSQQQVIQHCWNKFWKYETTETS